jgi:hypothetical protein
MKKLNPHHPHPDEKCRDCEYTNCTEEDEPCKWCCHAIIEVSYWKPMEVSDDVGDR